MGNVVNVYDQATLQAASQSPNTRTVVLCGQIVIDRPVDFTGAVNVIGHRRGAHLVVKDSTYGLRWNFSYRPNIDNSFPIKVALGGQEYFKFTRTPPLIARPFVLLGSHNQLPIKPHFSNGGQHPLELHQMVSQAGDKYLVSTPIIDAMDDQGFLIPLDLAADITVANFSMSYQGDQPQYCQVLSFNAVRDVNVENVTLEHNGPGAISFQSFANCRVQGVRIYGTAAQEGVYGVVCGVGNGLSISDCVINGTRHPFTTTSGMSNNQQKRRWGTPLNVIMRDSVINVRTELGISGRVGLDTHAEGYGIRFENVKVNIGTGEGRNVNVGAQTRSRATVYKDCCFYGGDGVSKLIRVLGPDCLIDGCHFEGGWRGIEIPENTEYCDNLRVRNCTFKNVREPLRIKSGDHPNLSNDAIATLFSPTG